MAPSAKKNKSKPSSKSKKAPAKVTKKMSAQPAQKISLVGKIASAVKTARAVVEKTRQIATGKSKVGQEVTAAKGKAKPGSAQSNGKLSKGQSSTARQLAKTRASLKGAIEAEVGAAANPICREIACESVATSGGYCRLHYIKNWKKIKRKELILKEGKLNQYIEELVTKYPDKYIEAIRQDLLHDKEFNKVVHDLELEEAAEDIEGEAENVDALVDNIRREYDDDTETF